MIQAPQAAFLSCRRPGTRRMAPRPADDLLECCAGSGGRGRGAERVRDVMSAAHMKLDVGVPERASTSGSESETRPEPRLVLKSEARKSAAA